MSPSGSGSGKVLLVGFDRDHETAIRRGENGGRTLRESNVVRSVREVGDWQGNGASPQRETPRRRGCGRHRGGPRWTHCRRRASCRRLSDNSVQSRRVSLAPVIVLDADDVVLAEIAAGLHLDQFEQDLAGIFQPVHRAHRDIDQLVLVHGLDQCR